MRPGTLPRLICVLGGHKYHILSVLFRLKCHNKRGQEKISGNFFLKRNKFCREGVGGTRQYMISICVNAANNEQKDIKDTKAASACPEKYQTLDEFLIVSSMQFTI